MAKVTLPLASVEARGALGRSLIFMGWKGKQIVKGYEVPNNPRGAYQKISRQKVSVCAANMRKITTPNATFPNGSKMYQMLRELLTPGRTWSSLFTSTILGYIGDDSNFQQLSSDYAAMSGGKKVVWTAVAENLTFDTLTGQQIATEIDPQLQLFSGAYGAYLLELSSYNYIYDDHPQFWNSAKIIDYGLDYRSSL